MSQKEEPKHSDPLLEYMNSHREITQEQINEAPLLILDEESNGAIFSQKQIKINAAGLIGGRNAKDGVAIFGIDDPENTNKQAFKADFNVKYPGSFKTPYVFAIYYQSDTKKYFIRAYCGKGSDNKILFIKLSGNVNLPLKQKEIISAGNLLFEVTPIEDGCLQIVNLSKKDSKEENKKLFDPTKVQEVTIGRGADCNFSFVKDKSFSRIQTTFCYDENTKEWTIIDGSKTKSSTNGTWVFGTHSFEIKDQMIAEILTSKVKFTFVKNDQ